MKKKMKTFVMLNQFPGSNALEGAKPDENDDAGA